jgi:hypothetical protein
MTRFFHGHGLERELRSHSPRPPDQLVQKIEERIRSERVLSRRSFRTALPVAFTAIVVGGLAAVGGVSYAASSVVHAARTVSHVFTPASAHRVAVVESLSSGGDQYVAGYQWGSPDHTTGDPPQVSVGGGAPGANLPPLTPSVTGDTATLTTSFKLDEQAHLFISIVDKTQNKELLITQTKSKASGKPLTGKQAKTVNYLVLVPRTIPLKIAVPNNLLNSTDSYVIRIIAVAPDGKKTIVEIPFTSS